MGELCIRSKKIFKDTDIFDGYILIKNGIIKEITKDKPSSNIEILNYENQIVASGYFDTHIHGYGGYDIMDCDVKAVLEISKGIVKNGVTSFLATTLTDSREKLIAACKAVYDATKTPEYSEGNGARIEGIFLEGPFFSEEFKGAQNEKYMSLPNIEFLKELIYASGGLVKKIAIAPELSGTEDFVRQAKELGVVVALGHSNATYDDAMGAVDLGASIFIHTYNAMSPLKHRDPGMVGAALSTENTYSEIICDGYHVHPAAVKIVVRAKTKEKTMLITDCMMAGGMSDGNYKLGDFDVLVSNGTARLYSGNLAGSILKMNDAVKNIINWGIANPIDAVNMASIVPSRSMYMDNRIGSIAVNKEANLLIADDSLNINHVMINGKMIF